MLAETAGPRHAQASYTSWAVRAAWTTDCMVLGDVNVQILFWTAGRSGCRAELIGGRRLVPQDGSQSEAASSDHRSDGQKI